MNFFEFFYNTFSLFKIDPPGKLKKIYNFNLWLNKLETTSTNIFSSVLFLLILSFILYFILSLISFQFAFSLLIALLIIDFYLAYFPIFYTKIVKIAATSESVWVTLYLVLYLKRNPNLEKAIQYVAYYMKGIIATDFKKLLYDLENKRFRILEEALEYYAIRWFYLSPDFVYIMSHLLNIKYRRTEEEINALLDRLLSWILKKAYQKSYEYVEKLKQPAVAITSFLIVLPIVSILMLPIMSVFLLNNVSFYFIAFGYIIILPILTFLVIQNLLSQNPFAFSTPDLSLAKDLPKKNRVKIGNKEVSIFPFIILFATLSIPAIYHLAQISIKLLYIPEGALSTYLNFIFQDRSVINALIMLTLPLGIGLSIGSYFYLNSFQKVKRANEIEEMEFEFPVIVYEFASLLEDGYPMEIVLEKTYQNYKIIKLSGILENFLKLTIFNLRKGLNLIQSIFDKNYGSINYYPSKIIYETLQLIIYSTNKGPKVLSQICYNVSKNLEQVVDIRIQVRRMLDEVIGLLDNVSKSIVPFMSSLVTIFNSAIISMLFAIAYFFQTISAAFGLSGAADLSQLIISTFNLANLIPPSYFQAIIGIFFIEFVIITSFFTAGIKYGFDETMIYYYIGRNLIVGTIFYVIFSTLGLIAVNTIFGPYIPTSFQI